MLMLVQLSLTRQEEMGEESIDISPLPASAKVHSPSVKGALATQSTQAEPASVGELKAALIQVHMVSLMLLSRFAVAHLSLRQADGLCCLTGPSRGFLQRSVEQSGLTHTRGMYELSLQMLN